MWRTTTTRTSSITSTTGRTGDTKASVSRSAPTRRLFQDLRFEVVQQVTEGACIASRFIVHGTNRGRRVRLTGIVISKIKADRIVEDFAVTDTVELVRQLGWWRTLLLVVTQPRLLRH